MDYARTAHDTVPVVVSHATALGLWRAGWEPGPSDPGSVARALGRAPSAADADAVRGATGARGVLHVVVGDASCRRCPAGLATHLSAALARAAARTPSPGPALVVVARPPAVGRAVLAVSPAVTALQMLRSAPGHGGRLVASELCGSFGAEGRGPLTSVAECLAASALLSADGVPPRRVRRALVGVVDGASSREEAACACLLALPRPQGGYGLPDPVAHGPSPHRKPATFSWPEARCALDLDRDGDPGRHEAFTQAGWAHVRVDPARLASAAGLDEACAVVASVLGLRRRPETPAMVERRARLVGELFGDGAAS